MLIPLPLCINIGPRVKWILVHVQHRFHLGNKITIL
jgi:hypothetical protein